MTEVKNLSRGVYRQPGEGLRHRHQLDPVDVDMGRLGRDPVHRIRDVLGGEWLHVGVDVGGARVVAVEAHVGELGAAAQAWLDVGDAYPGTMQVGPQVQAELAHEGLGRAVDVAAGIGPAARDRADVDHMAAPALHHAGQQRVRDLDQAGAVGVDHGLPVVQAGLLGRLYAQCQASVVDQQVDLGEAGRQRCRDGCDRLAVTHVQLERQ
jgi:hypothetical protein